MMVTFTTLSHFVLTKQYESGFSFFNFVAGVVGIGVVDDDDDAVGNVLWLLLLLLLLLL